MSSILITYINIDQNEKLINIQKKENVFNNLNKKKHED
jgi:hypothetical protein